MQGSTYDCDVRDGGLGLQVGVWTGISYALKGHPPGIVRRLALPNTWDYYSFWSTSAVRLAFLKAA